MFVIVPFNKIAQKVFQKGKILLPKHKIGLVFEYLLMKQDSGELSRA